MQVGSLMNLCGKTARSGPDTAVGTGCARHRAAHRLPTFGPAVHPDLVGGTEDGSRMPGSHPRGQERVSLIAKLCQLRPHLAVPVCIFIALLILLIALIMPVHVPVAHDGSVQVMDAAAASSMASRGGDASSVALRGGDIHRVIAALLMVTVQSSMSFRHAFLTTPLMLTTMVHGVDGASLNPEAFTHDTTKMQRLLEENAQLRAVNSRLLQENIMLRSGCKNPSTRRGGYATTTMPLANRCAITTPLLACVKGLSNMSHSAGA